MLQCSKTMMTESSTTIVNERVDILPDEVRALITLHREANAAINASQADVEIEPLCRRAESIYRRLVSVTPNCLQEEAERLSYVLAYLKEFTASDGQIDGGWLDMPQLQHIACNLTKLAGSVGSDALKVVSKSIQPVSRTPEPSLKAQLDRMEKERDVEGMAALFDYFIALNDAATFSINQPRASSIEEFVGSDSGRHCARAYAVADRLKETSPSDDHAQRERARVLLSAAFLMGGSLKEVAALMQCLGEGH